MIRKLLKGFALIYACFLLICLVGSCSSSANEDVPELLGWDRSGCKMLDYVIDGDRITIRYSVRIVSSDPDVDWKLSNFTVYYAPETVAGWLKHQKYYICTIEGGDTSVVIPRGETVDVILVLEGQYFHGKVPQDMPVFASMRYMLEIAQ